MATDDDKAHGPSAHKPAQSRALRWAPWIASFAAHAVVITAALLIMAPASTPTQQRRVAIDFFAPALSGADAHAPPPAQREDAPKRPPAAPERGSAPAPSFAAQVESEPSPFDARMVVAPALNARSAADALTPALTLDNIDAAGAALAGVGASDARRIVYALDASGSMVTTWPDAASAVAESIRALHPTQRFAILVHPQRGAGWPAGAAFSAPRIPPTAAKPTLLDATPDNIERALVWLAAQTPAGRSRPAEALSFAAKLAPDAIFLVSSGDWDAAGDAAGTPKAVVDRLRRALGGGPPVAIKVIAVEREDSTGALRAIADAFGGEGGYTLLTAAQLADRAGSAASRAER